MAEQATVGSAASIDHMQSSGVPIVLSLVPVRSGGGATVALITASAIAQTPELRREVTVVARRSLVEQMNPVDRSAIVAVSDNRVLAELQMRQIAKTSRADWFVSIFGPPPLLVAGKRTATVCAYGNLFYPPADWERNQRPSKRVVTRFRNWIRLQATSRSDVIFFETDLLRARARPQLARRTGSLRVLPPSRDPGLEDELGRVATSSDHETFTVLLLSAHHPNKRWTMLPAVAREVARRDAKIEFVLTSDEAGDLGGTGSGRIRQIGRVPAESRSSLLDTVDAILLISEVESFSNNFHEAWAAGIPLIVSDRDWSRAALGEAAVFVDPEDPRSIADGIADAMSVATTVRMRRLGRERLHEMWTPQERVARLREELASSPAPQP